MSVAGCQRAPVPPVPRCPGGRVLLGLGGCGFWMPWGVPCVGGLSVVLGTAGRGVIGVSLGPQSFVGLRFLLGTVHSGDSLE